MEKKEITVLMVEPGKHPRVTTLGTELDDLQKAVSIGADYQGLIEIIRIGNALQRGRKADWLRGQSPCW